MNIKSLLLGSAAALLAVSGARAADVIEVVAEPEPMDYVRICDTYGAKFYYIPGTETCLRVGGYLRYEFGVGDVFGRQSIDKKNFVNLNGIDINDTYNERSRLNLRFDARSETELGTLRGYGEVNFDWNLTAGSADFHLSVFDDAISIPLVDFDATRSGYGWSFSHMYIDLAGFRMGRTNSAFTTFGGGGTTMHDDAVVGYGPFDTNLISYTFTGGNGFSAMVSLETGSGDVYHERLIGGPFLALDQAMDDIYTIDSYMPHVAAGVAYEGGWGRASVVGGYDSNYEEWAVKGRLEVKATDSVTVYGMAAWKSNNDFNWYGDGWAGDWAVYGGLEAKVSDKLGVAVNLAYDDGDNFSAELNLPYTVVSDFTVTPSVIYTDNFSVAGGGEWGAKLRFQRDF